MKEIDVANTRSGTVAAGMLNTRPAELALLSRLRVSYVRQGAHLVRSVTRVAPFGHSELTHQAPRGCKAPDSAVNQSFRLILAVRPSSSGLGNTRRGAGSAAWG